MEDRYIFENFEMQLKFSFKEFESGFIRWDHRRRRIKSAEFARLEDGDILVKLETESGEYFVGREDAVSAFEPLWYYGVTPSHWSYELYRETDCVIQFTPS